MQSQPDEPIVQVAAGMLEGTVEASLHVYRGVPYPAIELDLDFSDRIVGTPETCPASARGMAGMEALVAARR